jgi:hypothetical protein
MGVNRGKQYFVCETVQPTDLDGTAFAALTWVRINDVGAFLETGVMQEIVNYATIDNGIRKAKGNNDPGNGDMEMKTIAADLGQIAMRTIGAPTVDGEYGDD